MLVIKNFVIELKNGFDGFISGLGVDEQRVSVLKYMLIEIF